MIINHNIWLKNKSKTYLYILLAIQNPKLRPYLNKVFKLATGIGDTYSSYKTGNIFILLKIKGFEEETDSLLSESKKEPNFLGSYFYEEKDKIMLVFSVKDKFKNKLKSFINGEYEKMYNKKDFLDNKDIYKNVTLEGKTLEEKKQHFLNSLQERYGVSYDEKDIEWKNIHSFDLEPLASEEIFHEKSNKTLKNYFLMVEGKKIKRIENGEKQ